MHDVSIVRTDPDARSPIGTRRLSLRMVIMQASSSASQRIERLLSDGVALANQISGFDFRDGQKRPVLGIVTIYPINHLREDG